MLMAQNLLLMRRRYRTSVSEAALFLATYGPFGIVLDFADASVAIKEASGVLDFTSQGQVSSGALVGPGAKLTYSAPSAKLTEQEDGNLGFQAHNLFLWSEDFSQATWTKVNCTATAGEITVASASNLQKYIQQAGLTTAAFDWRGSFELKQVSGGIRYIQLLKLGSVNNYVNFDLQAGTVGSAGSACVGSIELLPDGYYRCTADVTNATTHNDAWRVQIVDSTTAAFNAASTASGSVLIRKAHFRRQNSQPDYIATTSTPAYDLPYVYSGGVRQGIVPEPAATNLCLRSTEFSNTSVWLQSTLSVSPNTELAPDGTLTADTITDTGTVNDSIFQDFAVSASTAYTFSFYRKAGTKSAYTVAFRDNTAATFITTAATVTETALPNGWFRAVSTVTTPAGCTSLRAYPTRGNLVAGTWHIWGAQFETGAIATSPIITYGAAVARLADVQSTGVALFPYVDGGAITIFAEWSMPAFLASRSIANVRLNNSNIISLETGPSTTARHNGYIASGGVASYNTGLTSLPGFVGNKRYRSLLAADATSGFVAGDGEVGGEDLSIVIPTGLTSLNYGAYGAAGNQLNGGLVKVAVLPRKVSQSEAQAMTSFLNVYAEGDSITSQGGTDAYPILYRQSSAYSVRVTNDAVSGSTIADLVARAATLDGNIVSGLNNVLVVLAGHNDIEISGRTAAQVIADLSSYCGARKAAGWYVVVATLLPSTVSGFNTARATVNAAVVGWTGTYADSVWDVGADATIGSDAAASNATYYADGTHLTSAGRAVAAASLLPVLDGLVTV